MFNLFGEGFHWILESFLHWKLGHYLDDFVSIFQANTTSKQIQQETNAYIWLTNLLGIPRNNFKDCEGIVVSILGIEVDTNLFTACLPKEKLDRAISKTAAVLADISGSISLFDIQSLVGFLFFCSQAVCLGRVFMRRLWDFINQYPCHATKTTKRCIPNWIREDLKW